MGADEAEGWQLKDTSGNLEGRTAVERLKTRGRGDRASQGGGRVILLLSCLRLGYLVKTWTNFPYSWIVDPVDAHE